MSTLEDQITLYRLNQFPVESPYLLTKPQRSKLTTRNELFSSIIKDFPEDLGKHASDTEITSRDLGSIPESTLTYGEIDFTSLGEIFETLTHRFNCLPPNGVFYDLGSGTGKGVIGAALLGNFDHCIGIELLDSLYNISLNMKAKFEELRPTIDLDYAHVVDKIPQIEFRCGNIFEVDWTDASVILANSTCFSQSMMLQIADVGVRPGTVAISLSQRIPGPNWIMLESIKKGVSWGYATLNIQRRI